MGGASSSPLWMEADQLLEVGLSAPRDGSDVVHLSHEAAVKTVVQLRQVLQAVSDARDEAVTNAARDDESEGVADETAPSLPSDVELRWPLKIQKFNEPGEISCVLIPSFGATSSKKSMVLVGGDSGLIRSYDYRKGQNGITYSGHKRSITCLACVQSTTSSDLFASASKDKSVRIWRLNEPESLVTVRGHPQTVACVAMQETGLVTGCDDGKLRFWSFDTEQNSSALDQMVTMSKKKTSKAIQPPVLAVAVSDALIAVGRNDDSLVILSRAGQILKEIDHPGWVYAVQITDCGSKVVSGCSDGATRVFDVSPLVELSLASVAAPAQSFRSTKGTPPVVAAHVAKSKQLDLPPCARFSLGRNWIIGCAVDREATLCASACRDGGVHVWCLASATSEKIITVPSHVLKATKDTKMNTSSNSAATAAASTADDESDDVPGPNGVCFNWNGTLVAVPYTDGTLRIFKIPGDSRGGAGDLALDDGDSAAARGIQKQLRGLNVRRKLSCSSVEPPPPA